MKSRCWYLLVVIFYVFDQNALGTIFEDIIAPVDYHAFTSAKLSVEDYKVVWLSSPPSDVTVSLDAGSLEWVRVRDILVLPRARGVIKNQSNLNLLVAGPGYVTPVDAKGEGQFSVPLIAASDLSFVVKRNENGQTKEYRFRLEYQSRDKSQPGQVFFDASCSRFNMKVKLPALIKNEWLSVGCRLDPMATDNFSTANLEILIFWQRENSIVQVDSVRAIPAGNSEPIVIRATPYSKSTDGYHEINLKSDASQLALLYKLAPRIYRGNLSLGVGPYLFEFSKNQEAKHKTVIMPTLYASFATTSTSRLVAFEASPLTYPWITDLGLYLSYESLKFFDRRVSVQILLGGHLIGFDTQKGYEVLLGAPQGVELIGTDVFARGYNMSAGAFVFPWIGGKAYNNIWLRWGTRKLFIEANYIVWREVVQNHTSRSESAGLTLGFPLSFLSFM